MKNEKEIDKEFIKYFGKEKYEQLEKMNILQREVDRISEEYLGIPSIPVIYADKDMGEFEAMYDMKFQTIILNPSREKPLSFLLQTCFHELEHYYQLYYVTHFDTPKAKRWIKELETYDGKDPYQELEIDANAFARIVLLTEYDVEMNYEDKAYEMVVTEYINSKRILYDE